MKTTNIVIREIKDPEDHFLRGPRGPFEGVKEPPSSPVWPICLLRKVSSRTILTPWDPDAANPPSP